MLALHSSWFKACLSERWNTGGEATILDGKNRWVYELRFGKNNDRDDGKLLQRKTSSEATNTELINGGSDKLPVGTDPTTLKLHEKRMRLRPISSAAANKTSTRRFRSCSNSASPIS